jgi:hypothetical protein
MHVRPGLVQIANASQVLAYLKANRIDLEGILGRGSSSKGEASDMLDNGPASPGLAREQATNYQFLVPQFDNIPEKLKNLARWLLWRAEPMNGGKPRKVPYCPTLLNVRGSSTDPNTWGTFAQAEAAFDEGGYTGIAFVLNGDGMVSPEVVYEK